jgi:hypothetical protein
MSAKRYAVLVPISGTQVEMPSGVMERIRKREKRLKKQNQSKEKKR